ncbi:MAG: methionine--tRNA ligase subunit beta [Phycisphaerae bacterium]|nr:methionine--tRNA ligase subunit beta [Phycisphaerales bacterium]
MTEEKPQASGPNAGPQAAPSQPASSQPAPTTAASSADDSGLISIDDFFKVSLKVARVLEANDHPNADKLIVLKVDLGTEQRQICAGLRGHYEAASLVGKNIVVVANLAPRKMRGEVSQGMLLAASSEDRSKVILVTTDDSIEPGSSVG